MFVRVLGCLGYLFIPLSPFTWPSCTTLFTPSRASAFLPGSANFKMGVLVSRSGVVYRELILPTTVHRGGLTRYGLPILPGPKFPFATLSLASNQAQAWLGSCSL